MVSSANGDEEFSGSDADDFLEEDMEALRRACILTGTDLRDLQVKAAADRDAIPGELVASDSEEDDLELVRGIQQRFALCTHVDTPIPLCTLPPAIPDDEDDFETLRAIQRRFQGYESKRNSMEIDSNKLEQIHATNIALDKDTSNNLVVDSGVIESDQPHSHDLTMVPAGGSGFPKSAQMFVDAIKKNRACQKFIRSKLIQIESKIEENKKLRQRVKILKDFQVTCKKRTGRALSQKKDARVQLISVPKPMANSKGNKKRASALYFGPSENSHVASYRMVLTKYPTSFSREKWSDKERENLSKGIKQQFQELLLQKSVDLISDAEKPSGDTNDVDSIIASIRELDITPENIRSFLPKVNWDRLASMFATGRSGAECEARWLNYEDPLINPEPWTNMEDKKLLHVIQQRGIENWIDIAVLLGTNRTPFQCLARYQRSLNASILKREWTEGEDDKLRAAVEVYGESNWQLVASMLEGRTGTQCSNRWMKSLHPARQRVGRWTSDEDKRLKVAVMLFGPKTWKKIADFVPGRTHVQCRERWFNSLDPSLNLGEWTEEEDLRLKSAIAEHGYCWSKVATCVRPRTDSQCRRRWKVLLPDEVPLLQAARKIQKAALISNFVDRESERPALGPNDFIPLALSNITSESEIVNSSDKQNRKSRRRLGSKANTKVSGSKKPTKEADEVPLLTSHSESENLNDQVPISKKTRVMKQLSRKKTGPESAQDMINSGQEVRPLDERRREKTSFQNRNLKLRSEEKEMRTAPGYDVNLEKDRARPSCSKNSEGPDQTEAQSLNCASELLIMTNREKVGENDARKKKKASKTSRRKSKCVKLQDDVPGVRELDEDVRFVENNSTVEKTREPYLQPVEWDKHINPTEFALLPCPNSLPSRMLNMTDVQTSGDGGERKKKLLKLCPRKRKYDRLLSEHSEIKDSSGEETSDNRLESDDRDDDMTLACFINNKLKKRRILPATKRPESAYGKQCCNAGRVDVSLSQAIQCNDPKDPPTSVACAIELQASVFGASDCLDGAKSPFELENRIDGC